MHKLLQTLGPFGLLLNVNGAQHSSRTREGQLIQRPELQGGDSCCKEDQEIGGNELLEKGEDNAELQIEFGFGRGRAKANETAVYAQARKDRRRDLQAHRNGRGFFKPAPR